MATKKKVKPAWATPGKEWMEDNDDAHFSDNPAVRKTTRKKIEKLPKGHPAVKITKKKKVVAKKSITK